MATTDQLREATAGRKAAIEFASELYLMDRDYMIAFCRELLRRLPSEVKQDGI